MPLSGPDVGPTLVPTGFSPSHWCPARDAACPTAPRCYSASRSTARPSSASPRARLQAVGRARSAVSRRHQVPDGVDGAAPDALHPAQIVAALERPLVAATPHIRSARVRPIIGKSASSSTDAELRLTSIGGGGAPTTVQMPATSASSTIVPSHPVP